MENIGLGQALMILIWVVITIGIVIFLKSTFDNKPSSIRQALDKKRAEEEAAEKQKNAD